MLDHEMIKIQEIKSHSATEPNLKKLRNVDRYCHSHWQKAVTSLQRNQAKKKTPAKFQYWHKTYGNPHAPSGPVFFFSHISNKAC